MRPADGIVRFTPIDEDGRTLGPSTFVNAESIEVTGPDPEPDRYAELSAGFAALGETLRVSFGPLRGAFGRAAAQLAAAFGVGSYIPPGHGTPPDGEPITTGYQALYVLNWAAGTEVVARLSKAQRRYAKARYLECRRVIIATAGRSAWPGYMRRRGGVAVNQFVST